MRRFRNMHGWRIYIYIILLVATLDWAVWMGGQIFNELMIIPAWSHDIPGSIRIYQQNMLAHITAYFFVVANPVFFLPFLALAWYISLRYKSDFTTWLGAAVVLDLVITLSVGLWMAPTIQGVFDAAESGEMTTAAMRAVVQSWRTINTIRIFLGVITCLLFLITISKFHLLHADPNAFAHQPLRTQDLSDPLPAS